MAVRFCEHCNQPFQEGHILYEEHTYCSESCLRLDNTENEDVVGKSLDEMYDNDIQYYTEWSEVEPYYTVVPVFEVFDTFFFNPENARKVASEHPSSKELVKHKYLLISQEDYQTPDNSMDGYSSTEYKVFAKLQDVRHAYEEIEETELTVKNEYDFDYTTTLTKKELAQMLEENGLEPTRENIDKLASEICIDDILGDSITEQLKLAIEEHIEKSFVPQQ